MKVVRYRSEEGESYGVLMRNKVVDLPSLAEKLPKKLESFIGMGQKGVAVAEKLTADADGKDVTKASFQLSGVTLLAPIVSPPKIICLGLNYYDHAEEQDAKVPDEPIIFMKPRTAIIGPKQNIVKPSFVKQLDYEAELAIVIGKKAKNVSASNAQSYVLGYTILNDISARDVQFRDKQWTRGKSFDTFAPTGPCITTANQLEDTSDLSIRTWVNSELRQNSTTKKMVFNVNEIIGHLSRVMTLESCDIIATGTPAGVGFAFKPQPKFLQVDDVVRIEIEKIGTLENVVVEESHA